MAIQNWKNFLMAYEQAIDDLKAAARLMENGETKREGPAYASKEAAWAMLSRIYLFMSGNMKHPIVKMPSWPLIMQLKSLKAPLMKVD